MHTLPLSEFRAHVAAALDLVEQGQTVRILRHGKPVADLVPVAAAARDAQPAWKQAIEPAHLAPADGKTVSQHLIEGRGA
ncbi:prevent-host-death family protein [Inhella inkyongensis]|uniref:Antitoxin n=1 Tax=Inhella inkyongensis TaxID=392593 RepID=A0A840S5U6_9BURK|nr:type II toxin-antitoxin system Phd/YefM family antitoxin [Inhella inkyongensis]MBB5205073.1 prevent-host-death family protein [Inhella inkyongensis]